MTPNFLNALDKSIFINPNLSLTDMTNREFIDKNGNTWNWEETPETVAALKKLHNTSVNNRVNKPNAPKE